MFNEDDIRKALKPFSENLKSIDRIKNATFYAVFDSSVDENEVERVLKKELNPESIVVDRKDSEVSIKIIDWD